MAHGYHYSETGKHVVSNNRKKNKHQAATERNVIVMYNTEKTRSFISTLSVIRSDCVRGRRGGEPGDQDGEIRAYFKQLKRNPIRPERVNTDSGGDEERGLGG